MTVHTSPIGGPLLDRVVYWAKAQGLTHEMTQRACALRHIGDAPASGMSYAQACELMDRIETGEVSA